MRSLMIGLAAVGGLVGAACADPMTDGSAEMDLMPLSVAAPVADTLDGLDVVAETDLQNQAGGSALDELQLSTATTNGSTDNNVVSGNVTTGAIGNTNVQNVNGFNTMMFNTGNNVVMQSTTQVNIILK